LLNHANPVTPLGLGYSPLMTTERGEGRRRRRKRIAPIFPVRDLRVSLAHYQALGFTTREYDGGYGFAELDRAEIHLGVAPDGQATTPSSAYLFVEDADDLATRWMLTGADVRAPEDTEWGQREGVVIDPDGNVLRFGSPLHRTEGE
jgi:Glyoxalase/Bleomycin resistance protein/Dioxygenase superfamily